MISDLQKIEEFSLGVNNGCKVCNNAEFLQGECIVDNKNGIREVYEGVMNFCPNCGRKIEW